MLVSNAVIAQTKCRSAAVDEEETGSRQGAPAAAGEGRGGGSVSLTRAGRGWFTCGWRTYSLPGKAGRAVGVGREGVIGEESLGPLSKSVRA